MRILYVEDEIAHAELTQRTLENNIQYEFRLIHADTIKRALELLDSEPDLDLILCHLYLPDGTALDLLKRALERKVPPAVVIMAEQDDQEIADATLKAGAADYVVKHGDYLSRLPEAIINAVAKNKLVSENAALRETQARFRTLVEQLPAAVYTGSVEKYRSGEYMSPQIQEITGYTPEEWMRDHFHWIKCLHPEDREWVIAEDKRSFQTQQDLNIEYRLIHRTGKIVWIRDISKLIYDGGRPIHWQGILYDITKEKESQAALQRQLQELIVLHAATVAGTESYSEDEIIQKVTGIIGRIYTEVCGILLLNQEGTILTPHFSYMGADVSYWQDGYPVTEGITGKCASTGQILRIDVLKNEPKYIEIAPGIQSELCVPIRVNQNIIGVINVESKETHAFNEDDERLLITVAGSLGSAIARLRLYKEEQRHAQDLDFLYQATRALTQSLEPEIIGQNLIGIMENLLGYEYGGILMLDETKQQIVPLALSRQEYTKDAYQKEMEYIRSLNIKAGRGIVGWVIENGQPVRSGEVNQDPRYLSARQNIRSELCVPLIARNKVIGAINIETTRPHAYSENDETLLSALASSVAIALENARLYEAERVRRGNSELLREATAILTTSVELENLYDTILISAAKLIEYDSASIELLQGEYFEIVAGRGIPNDLIGERYLLDATPWGGKEAMHHPITIYDVQMDDRFRKFKGTEYIRSWLGLPLLAQGKLMGYINLDSRIPGFYNKDHVDLVQTFANQAAIAIEKAQLFHEQNRRSKIIETLAEIANEIATTRDVIPALEKISHRALELLKANHVAIYLLQDDQITLKPITAHGVFRKELLSHTRRIGEGITGRIFLNGKPEIIHDLASDSRRVQIPGTPKEDEILETLMSSPLILRGKPIGVINAWRLKEEGLFNETELNFLVSIANQASICIESGRLFQETKRQAQEADAIAEVGRDISASLQLDVVLERIAAYAKDLIHSETSAVYLTDENTTSLRAIAAIGLDSEEIKNDPLEIGSGILGNIAVQKIGEIVNDTTNDQRTIIVKGTVQNPLEHIMGVPILFGEKLTGLLAVWRTGRGLEFGSSELEFASRLAQEAAIALENARLYESELTRREQAEVLQEVTANLSTSLDINALYQIILDSLTKLISHDSASIFMESGQDEMEIVAASGFTDQISIVGKRLYRTAKWHELASSRKALIVADIQTDMRFEKWQGTERIRGWMGVPMIAQDQVIGFINLDSNAPNTFTEKDATLTQTFANSCAVVIQNAFLYATEREQREREASMLELMRVTTSSLELNEVMQTILGHMIDLIPSDSGTIQLLEGKELHITATHGFDKNTLSAGQMLSLQNFPINREVIETKTPVWVNDAEQNERYRAIEGIVKVNSFIAIPLIYKGRAIGLATLDSHKKNRYSPNDAELALALANHAAIALANARLYNETQLRLKELETINRISTSFRMAQSLGEQLPILLNETLELVNTPHGSIWLYDHTSDKLVQQVSSGAVSKLKHTSLSPLDGIVGRTFTTGKIHISADLKNDPLLFEPNRESIQPGLGAIFIPIQSTIGPVGVLLVSIETGRQITEEINLLTILAEITGNSIHRAQLYEQSQKQVRRLTTLRDIDAAIASSFDLHLTLNILADQTISHLNVDAVDIALYHPNLQSLTYITSAGFNTHSPTRPQVRIGEGLAGKVIVKQRTHHVTNLQNTYEIRNELLIKREGFVTYIGIPLIVKGHIKGVFEVFHRSPLSPTPDWMEFLHTLAGQAAIAIDNSQLFENLQHSNQELIQAYDTTLEGWARALELRDRETEGHTRRVTELTLRLARYMGINDNEMVNIHRGVLLHDIGKMGVPDIILKKTGTLTEDEWIEMRQHPVYAYNLLSPISYLRNALDIPYCHHEHWDGSGYPRGLKGEQIPLAARIFSAVDIWDALLTDRPYRKAWPREQVIDYLKEVTGKHLDPKVVSIFLKMVHEDESKTG